jgi:hypothetical protein
VTVKVSAGLAVIAGVGAEVGALAEAGLLAVAAGEDETVRALGATEADAAGEAAAETGLEAGDTWGLADPDGVIEGVGTSCCAEQLSAKLPAIRILPTQTVPRQRIVCLIIRDACAM